MITTHDRDNKEKTNVIIKKGGGLGFVSNSLTLTTDKATRKINDTDKVIKKKTPISRLHPPFFPRAQPVF